MIFLEEKLIRLLNMLKKNGNNPQQATSNQQPATRNKQPAPSNKSLKK